MSKKHSQGTKKTKGYAVGHGKPPKEWQFQPGKSGNPKGRPKGSKNRKSELRAVFDQKVPVTINGKSKMVPLSQALVIRAATLGLQGHIRALELALDLYEAAYPAANDNEPLCAGSSFELTAEDLAAIAKSNLLKGLK